MLIILLYSFTCTKIITIKELLSDSTYALIFEGFIWVASVQNPTHAAHPSSPKGFLTQVRWVGEEASAVLLFSENTKFRLIWQGSASKAQRNLKTRVGALLFLLQSFPSWADSIQRQTRWFRIHRNLIFRRKTTFVPIFFSLQISLLWRPMQIS